MKKILLVLTTLLIILSGVKKAEASVSYDNFQEIEISSGKLLSDYTENEYSKYYKKVLKRKFMGWNTYDVNKDIKTKFVSETVFSYYNQGKTSVTYNYSLSNSKTSKFSISATGSISYSFNNGKKTFKNGLSAALKIDGSYTETTDTKEEESLKVVIDPGTCATLRIIGEGKLTNGVAAYYFFWINSKKGGYEYFIVTTEYPRLEILPI